MGVHGRKRASLIVVLLWTLAGAGHCAKIDDSPRLCLLLASTCFPTILVTVQTGTLTIAGAGASATYTETATINSVDTASSFLIFQTRHSSNRPPGSTVRGTLTNSTTLTFTKTTDETSTLSIRWYVVTYPDGYINVQTGSSVRATNPLTQAITAVGALSRTFALHSLTVGAGDNTWNNDDAVTVSFSATDSLRLNSDAANAAHTVRWQAVEYLNADQAEVQSNTTSLTGGALSASVALTTAVDTTRTLTLASLSTAGTGADVGARLLRARLSDSSTVLVERAIGGDADDMAEIHVQTVELKDGSSVQSGVISFATGEAQKNIAISTIDTTKSAALLSGQSGAGQSMGMSDYAGDDIPGVCSVTTTLTASQLTLDRDNTAGSCEVAWYVIKFGT